MRFQGLGFRVHRKILDPCSLKPWPASAIIHEIPYPRDWGHVGPSLDHFFENISTSKSHLNAN